MSLRKRLMLGIALLLTVLWLAAIAWFLVDVRGELRDVLDARLASSAHMVQGLLARGDLQVDPGRFASAAADRHDLPQMPTRISCQLWTLDGQVLTYSDEAQPLTEEPDTDGFSTQYVQGQLWRVYALTDPVNGIRIATAERQSLRTVLVRDVALAVSLPFLLALPGMGLLIWVGVGRGLKPLLNLRDTIRSRHANALEALPEQEVPSEVVPLVQALNALFARLSETIERERRFTGNAAHELRTPLAGIKTQLQIAQNADGETRRHALAQANKGVDRMTRLVAQLLTLARVDALEPDGQPPETSGAALQQVLRDVGEELRPAADKAEVELEVSFAQVGELSDRWIRLPADMLHTALRNLLDNAINHSPSNGAVRLAVIGAGDAVNICVIDSGPGLDETRLSGVTRRFYRASDRGTGSGLGLSIVEAICERYGADLSLENRSDQSGLQVCIHCPLRSRSADPAQ